MTDTTDNVIPLQQPGTAPEPRTTPRRKDPRAAARKAKSRSKSKADRDAKPNRAIVPLPPVDASPIVPTATQSEVDGATPPAQPRQRHGAGAAIDVAAYTAAVALAGAAAFFSVKGMVTLFPGAPLAIIGMAAAMESAKLITAGWLARRWRATAPVWRLLLVVLVFGLAVINAAGVYAQLVSAHVGERGAATSDIEAKDAALAAKIEVAVHNVADLDRRLNQVDVAIEEAAKRGKTNAALSAMEGQRKARGALADRRQREGVALADFKTERATLGAKGKQIETEAAPIRYVAELLGADADSERAIRWLIALMVLCCDPLAIALTAAASARRTG
jgi:hypothetical protein